MTSLRKYGNTPFTVVVVHGGPGAAGEVAPVALELSLNRGVLEPYQTASSLRGQIDELKTILENHSDYPVTLIGYSWGAWLSTILVAQYPALVRKLILVSSGPFEEKYSTGIQSTRLNRLSEEEQQKVYLLSGILENPSTMNRNKPFAQIGALLSKADAYNPSPVEYEEIDYRFDIFNQVWPEAAELRRSGTLLELVSRITCPVLAIHGDYDPHPAEGVQKPLSHVVANFRFYLLKNCGHKPWVEKEARHQFFSILEREL